MKNNNNLSVLITIDGNIPSKKAHSFNVAKMAQGFFQAGHDTELVSLLSLPNIIDQIKLGKIHRHYGIDERIRIKLLPVFNRDFFIKKIHAKNFNKRAGKYFKLQNPDLVYCRSYLSVIECIKNEIPCIIESHTTGYDHPDLQKVFELAKNQYFLGFVTINEILKQEYVKRGVPEEKILVMEDGVDLNSHNIDDDRHFWRKQLKLDSYNNIVVYTGGLYREKGIESILKTAKLCNDIKFVLVGGEAEQIKEWQNFCIDNGVKNALFTGFKPNSELPKYLKAADVLFMPYDTALNYKVMDINTTSPLKLFEYIAAKRPVVSSDIPVVSKIVKHNETALLAEENSIEHQAGLIKEMLNNPQKAEEIALNAYKKAKQYEWKERCRKITETFLK